MIPTLSPLMVLFEALCVALFFTTFCRLAKLDRVALLRARLAYFVLGGTIIGCMYFATFKGYEPSGPDCALLAAFTLVQVISGRAWKGGYPAHLSSRPTPLDEVPNEPAHRTV